LSEQERSASLILRATELLGLSRGLFFFYSVRRCKSCRLKLTSFATLPMRSATIQRSASILCTLFAILSIQVV
jgi:hypothetical protein